MVSFGYPYELKYKQTLKKDHEPSYLFLHPLTEKDRLEVSTVQYSSVSEK